MVGSITTLPVFVLHKPRMLSIDRRHNLGKPGSQCVNVESETVKCWMRMEDMMNECYAALNSPEGSVSPKEMRAAASTNRKLRLQQALS